MARGIAESCPDGGGTDAEALGMGESGEEACCRLGVDGGGDRLLDDACGGVCIVGPSGDSALPLPVRALGSTGALLAGGSRLADGRPVDGVPVEGVLEAGRLEGGMLDKGVLADGTLADCPRTRAAQLEPLPVPLPPLRGGADIGRTLLALRVEGTAPYRRVRAVRWRAPGRTRPRGRPRSAGAPFRHS